MSRSFALVILALAMAQARSLPLAWFHSPYDSLGLVAAVIWAIPILLACRGAPSPAMAWCAVALGVAAAALDLHVISHVALAVAAAALAIRSINRLAGLVWLLSAISWMPALSYFLGGIGSASPGFTAPFRICIALVGCFAASIAQRIQIPD